MHALASQVVDGGGGGGLCGAHGLDGGSLFGFLYGDGIGDEALCAVVAAVDEGEVAGADGLRALVADEDVCRHVGTLGHLAAIPAEDGVVVGVIAYERHGVARPCLVLAEVLRLVPHPCRRLVVVFVAEEVGIEMSVDDLHTYRHLRCPVFRGLVAIVRAATIGKVRVVRQLADVLRLAAAAVVQDDVDGSHAEGPLPEGLVADGLLLGHLCAGPLARPLRAALGPRVDVGSRLGLDIDVDRLGLVHAVVALAQSLDGDVVADVVGIVRARCDELVALHVVARDVTADAEHRSFGALHLDDVAAALLSLFHDGALVGDATGLAGQDHVTQSDGVALPVLVEHARRAGHGQNEGVCCHYILRQAVLVFIGIVIINKRYCIAVPIGAAGYALAAKRREVAPPKGLLDDILQGEVEGCRCLARAVDPAGDGLERAVPVFADTELRRGSLVVHLGIIRIVALDHVEAVAVVAQVVAQVVEVCLHVLLHVGRGVVEVAAAAEVVARVVGPGHRPALLLHPSAVVVLADVGAGPVEGVCLLLAAAGGDGLRLVGKVDPRAVLAHGGLMVDDHVHDDLRAALVVGIDHLRDVTLAAPVAGMVEPVDGHVAHALAAAVAGVIDPEQVEIGADVVGLLDEFRQTGIGVGVPIESLEHDATIVGRPLSCGVDSQEQRDNS